MKILIIAHESEFVGGANRALFALIKWWKENSDVEVSVLLPQAKGSFYDALMQLEIPVVIEKYLKVFTEKKQDHLNILRYAKVYAEYLYNSYKEMKIAKSLKEVGFDVIYTNTRMTSLGGSIAKYLNIPQVIHIREFGNSNTFWGPSSIERIYDKSAYIIAISEALKRQLVQDIPEDKITVSYDGVNYYYNDNPLIYHKNVVGEKFNAQTNSFKLLITGRITEAKGQSEAIEALAQVRDKGYDSIVLYVAGSVAGNSGAGKAYMEKLQNMVDILGLQNNVVFLGEVNDMKSLRKEMDIELMCAERETLGWVTIEGMRSGLMVIGSNTGATPEIITHQKTGLLYQQGNAASLAEQIVWAIEHPEATLELMQNGYKFAMENFRVEKNAEEVLLVLKNAIELKK